MESRRVKIFYHKGFTLIEVLVVLIIIGIASSLTINGLGNSLKNNKDESTELVELLDRNINHVFQTGETIKIYFDTNQAKVIKNETIKEEFKFKKIFIEQSLNDMRSSTDNFHIHLNQKQLIDTITILLSEDAKKTKLILGVNGVKIYKK